MANTPEPCCCCRHLYYDALGKDNPNCYIDCFCGKEIGNVECDGYEADPHADNVCPICGKDHHGKTCSDG